jgi:hypothetical protein
MSISLAMNFDNNKFDCFLVILLADRQTDKHTHSHTHARTHARTHAHTHTQLTHTHTHTYMHDILWTIKFYALLGTCVKNSEIIIMGTW